MKRSIAALALTLTLVSCSGGLRAKFPEYYELGHFKGIEVYVWQSESGEYLCGALPGTNRMKEPEELEALTKNPATVDEMRKILDSYDMPYEDVIVMPYTPDGSETAVSVEKINELFEKNYHMVR